MAAMYECPSCHQEVFRWRDKWRALARRPLSCPACQSSCWMHAAPADGWLVLAVLLALCAGMAALALQSVLPWIAGLAVWLLLRAWDVHRRPLQARPPLSVPPPKRTGAWGALDLLILYIWWR